MRRCRRPYARTGTTARLWVHTRSTVPPPGRCPRVMGETMSNVVVWVDIPVKDMKRAREFYEHLLGNPIEETPGSEGNSALLMPMDAGTEMDVSADLATAGSALGFEGGGVRMTEPSSLHGPIIYLSAKDDIDGMLVRAVEAGGKIHAPKQDFGEMGGWLALIVDTEGNLIGLSQSSA